MSDLKLNDDGTDLELDSGDLAIVEGPEALAQRIAVGLSIFQTELRFNTEWGIPWFALFEVAVQEQAIETAIRRQLLNTPGVERIDTLNVSRDKASRTLTISYGVNGVPGQTVLR
jgi:hypothetical protein